MKLPLGRSAYDRAYAKQPPIRLENRMFEDNPTNLEDGASLLSRPATSFLDSFGVGPIRSIWYQDGTIDGAAFITSGDNFYRYDQDGTKTLLPGLIDNNPANPSVDGTDDNVYVADGSTLQYYNGIGSFGSATLTFTGNAADGNTVTTGGFVYTFNTVLGGASSVLIGADETESIANLVAAITGVEGEGTVYGLDTPSNTAVSAVSTDTDKLTATALTAGVAGNSVVTTETVPNATWDTATLEGGAANALNGIPTPDDVAVVSLAVLGGFVLCAVAETDRVYFIRPLLAEDEVPEIDPLDFFEAERIPDQIVSLRVVGDELWIFGVDSTEVWYLSGVGAVPFDRIRGRAFSIGIVEGTDVEINDQLFVTGNDGVVYQVSGGLNRISTHGIEEKIRKAREEERVT